jgi:sulfonate transport system substrate-binding protein
LIEAMNANAIDLGVVGDAPFTFGLAAGVKMKVIAARRSTQAGLALLVLKDSPAQSLTDLKGKRVATGRGSIGHFLVLSALRREKLPDDFVTWSFMLPADARSALLSGAIEAWSTWEPYTSQLEVIDGARQIVNGANLTPGQGFQIASEPAIAALRDELSDFIARITAARVWANAHTDEYANIWAKLMRFPLGVPRNWFARTKENVVVIDEFEGGQHRISYSRRPKLQRLDQSWCELVQCPPAISGTQQWIFVSEVGQFFNFGADTQHAWSVRA